MILPGGKYHVYLATRPVDFRKGHAGLSLVIQTVLGPDPFSGAVFVFRSKRGDRIKILVWDQIDPYKNERWDAIRGCSHQ